MYIGVGIIVYIIIMFAMCYTADSKLYTKVKKGKLVANRTFTVGGYKIIKGTVGADITDGVAIPKPSIPFWVGKGTTFRGNVTIERDVYIEKATLSNCTILSGTAISRGSAIIDSTVGNNCVIGVDCYISESQIGEQCILGESASVTSSILHNGVRCKNATIIDSTIYNDVEIGYGVYMKDSIIGHNSLLCSNSSITSYTLPENTKFVRMDGFVIRSGICVTYHQHHNIYHLIETADKDYYMVGTGISLAIKVEHSSSAPNDLMHVYNKFLNYIPRGNEQ